MKKILVPSRSQRNHSSGMFKANSLGSIQGITGKPVDMDVAKASIRQRRRMMSGEYQRLEREKMEEVRKRRASRAWWNRRRSWASVQIDNRIGKLHPGYGNRGWVEFPDGTQQWVDDV